MSLSGKTFCIAGGTAMLREDIINLLKVHGGQVEESITKNVTHFIAGDCGSVLVPVGITLISELDVHRMIAQEQQQQQQQHVPTLSDESGSREIEVDENAVQECVDDDVQNNDLRTVTNDEPKLKTDCRNSHKSIGGKGIYKLRSREGGNNNIGHMIKNKPSRKQNCLRRNSSSTSI